MALRLARCSPFSTTCLLARLQVPFNIGLLRHQLRNMASATTKSEWLVIVPDVPGTVAKRLEVRHTHLANTTPLRGSGILKTGGAIVDDIPSDPADPTTYKFVGSTLTIVADSRAEVVKLLENDIYTKQGVWDVEKAQIYWLKSAFRDP